MSITKKLSLKPSIFSKNTNSDFFFHNLIIIKKVKKIHSEIVLNSFKFEAVPKHDMKN